MLLLDPVLSFSFTATLACLFCAAVFHKIKDPLRFRNAVQGYRLAPESLASAMAALIILLEAGVVVGSLAASTRVFAMLAACVLLSLYATAIAVNLARGRTRIDCGCAGPGDRNRIGAWMIRRNVLIAVVALLAACPASTRAISPMDIFVIGCATCSAAALYSAHGILADARQRWAG